MARIRTIKPEFWTSEQVVECSTNARLLFVGLWNFADDDGRHVASVKRLKMEVFPGDPFTFDDVRGMVDELIAAGLLVEYEAQGVAVWQVTGWHHQKIDKPRKSQFLGPFDDGSTIVRRTVAERSEGEWKGMEGNGRESISADASASALGYTSPEETSESGSNESAAVSAIVQRYNDTARKHGWPEVRKVTAKRRNSARRRLREQGWAEAFRDALDRGRVPNDERFRWQPDFDWFVANDSNVHKFAEGRYHQRQQLAGCDVPF